MPSIDPRDERMFPKLSPAEIDRLLRFGELQRYGTGQPLFVTGEIAPGTFVLKSGRVQVKRRDRLGSLAPVALRWLALITTRINSHSRYAKTGRA